MTLLGFKGEFVPLVERRFKRHSVRASLGGGHKVGRPIQLYRDVRQPTMRKIVSVDPLCTKIEPIKIHRRERGGVRIDHRWLSPDETYFFACRDGFGGFDADVGWGFYDDAVERHSTLTRFFEFFTTSDDPVFEGFLIHWDWPE